MLFINNNFLKTFVELVAFAGVFFAKRQATNVSALIKFT